MMRTFVSFHLVLCLAATCSAQAQAVLHASDLESDAALLRQAYEQLHPGLYRYNTAAEMNAHFDALSRDLNHDQSLRDAFLSLSQFAATVRCGHTQLNPFNQSDSVVDALFKIPARLPFYFEWVDGCMIVTRDFSGNPHLVAGTEVLSVDGVPVATILERLMTVARADGGNDAKRIAQLGVSGDSRFEAFDIYYPLFFPPKGPTVELQVKAISATLAETVTAKFLTFEERLLPIKERDAQKKDGTGVLFEWKDLADGTAYLRMPTWALYNSKWDWKAWLDAHLDAAARRRARALVIDLRGNEGGDDVGNRIIPHLIDAPTTVSPMRRLVRYREVPSDLAPYLDTWDPSFRNWGKAAVEMDAPWPTTPAGVHYFRLTRFDDNDAGDVIAPAGQRFLGRVFVLIDATNSSATFQFAQGVQRHRLGILVGLPTGGSKRGINGGAFFFLRLPHSGIELDLPLIGTFPPGPEADSGVAPDILVGRSRQDIASGRDATLEAALGASRE